MEIEQILRDFGLILGAGLVSQLIATIIKIPQMVVLVAAGVLIGPSVLVSNPLGGVGAADGPAERSRLSAGAGRRV